MDSLLEQPRAKFHKKIKIVTGHRLTVKILYSYEIWLRFLKSEEKLSECL
jgi:hypothetical protein